MLLEAKAIVDLRVDDGGWTPLMAACRLAPHCVQVCFCGASHFFPPLTCYQTLLEAKANPRVTDVRLWTPLQLASYVGSVRNIKVRNFHLCYSMGSLN